MNERDADRELGQLIRAGLTLPPEHVEALWSDLLERKAQETLEGAAFAAVMVLAARRLSAVLPSWPRGPSSGTAWKRRMS